MGHVAFSFLVISCQILGIIYPYEGCIYGSPAIFCGLLFGFSGSIGIWAGCHTSKCTIISHMVLAILSACLAIPLIAHSILFSIIIANGTTGGFWYENDDDISRTISIALFISLAVLGFTQAVLSVVASCISCKVICCQQSPLIEDKGCCNKRDVLNMSRKPVMWMSGIQLVASVVAIILNIVGNIYPYNGITLIGSGIWSAIPFIMCGVVGMWAGSNPSKCPVITLMVMAIISSCTAVLYLGISIIGFATSSGPEAYFEVTYHNNYYNNYKTYYYNNNNTYYYNYLSGYKTYKLYNYYNYSDSNNYNYSDSSYYYNASSYNYRDQQKDTEGKVTFGLFLVQTLIALIQLEISVSSSAMACQPICCPTNNREVQKETKILINSV